MDKIQRDSRCDAVSITTAVGTTPEIDKRNYAGGIVAIPTGSSIAQLTFHAAPKPGGTFVPLNDKAAAEVTMAVESGQAYELPDAIYGCPVIKIVGDAAGDIQLGWVS